MLPAGSFCCLLEKVIFLLEKIWIMSKATWQVCLKQLEEKELLPDKEKDQIVWVGAANQHRAIVEEIILKELIYV